MYSIYYLLFITHNGLAAQETQIQLVYGSYKGLPQVVAIHASHHMQQMFSIPSHNF